MIPAQFPVKSSLCLLSFSYGNPDNQYQEILLFEWRQYFCFYGPLKIFGREGIHREILNGKLEEMAFLGHLLLAPDNTRKGNIDAIGTMTVGQPKWLFTL